MTEQIVGITLAGCKIIKLLGKGGMGSVYLGRQVDLGRFVALKILSKNLIQEEGFLRRFRREARSVASLSHPNIVQVFQYGEEDGIHFIVMEYIEGETLGARVSNSKTLEEAEAIRIAKETATAIQEAQRKNIVHRDIKPDNIILDKSGQVKVTDFGLAKNLSGSQDQSLVTKQIIGTPAYISPEQIKGTEIDPRSDIYSLGATLYHVVAGKPPFTARNPFELLEKHLKEKPVPPKEINEELSEGISDVVLKCLAKDPKGRYQSCQELIEDLERVEMGSRALAGRGRGGWATGWPVRLAVAAVFIAAIAWVGVRLSSSQGQPGNGSPVAGTTGGSGNPNPSTTGPGATGPARTGAPATGPVTTGPVRVVPAVDPEAEKRKRFNALVDKGREWEEKGRIEFAIETYNDALEIRDDDDLAEHVEDLSRRLAEAKRIEEEREHFRDLKDRGLQALYDYSFQERERRDPKLLAQAMDLLDKAQEIDPGHPRVKWGRRQAQQYAREVEMGGPAATGPRITLDPPVTPEGRLPEVPFQGIIFLKNGGVIPGTIVEVTEEKVSIKTGGGIMHYRPDEVEAIEVKGLDVRFTGENIGEATKKPVEYSFKVPHRVVGPDWIEIRYDFRSVEQMEDWAPGGWTYKAQENGVLLLPGRSLEFKTRFEGEVEIQVLLEALGEGTFQTRIYSHNVSIGTKKGTAPGLGEEWAAELREGEEGECAFLAVNQWVALKVRREKKKVYVQADYGKDIQLAGEIKSGLGIIGFGAQGTGFLIRKVILAGKPRP